LSKKKSFLEATATYQYSN